MASRILAAFFVALLGPTARSQELLLTDHGSSKQRLGWSVAGGPDVDGDGIIDVAVGAPSYALSGVAGTVRVLSGRDFSSIITLSGSVDEYFGFAVCWCGDLDGDGLSELAVGVIGAGSLGEVRVFASSTWTLLRTLTATGVDLLGWSFAKSGDFDGDGFDDLYVGERGGNSNGAVTLFSGKDGSILQTISSTVSSAGFGEAIAVVGDADGDGIADVAVGSPGLDLTTQNENSGAVDLRSGADGSLLWQQLGSYGSYVDPYTGFTYYVGDEFGSAVDAAGDVDADGRADVAASTYADAGYTSVLSGKDGAFLRKIQFVGRTRGALAAMGDLSGDGLPELGVAFSGGIPNPSFAILSSFDGKVLWRTDEFGVKAPESIALTPDVDGDGLSEFLLGFPRDGSHDEGRVELRTTRDLWLDATTHLPDQLFNARIALRANEGPNGNLAALVLTSVDGSPTFLLLSIVAFDATRSALLFSSNKLPSNLRGHLFTVRALAVGASGRLVQSADETIAPK
jgi:hypothetical protein